MQYLKPLFALFFAILLIACSSEQSLSVQPVVTQLEPARLQQQWELIGIDGLPLGLGIRSELKISPQNKATGNLACNYFFGKLEYQNNTLKINKMGTTRQKCQDNIIVVEKIVSKVLNNWSEVLLMGDRLTLVGRSHRLNYKIKR